MIKIQNYNMEDRVKSFIISFAVMFLVFHLLNDAFQLIWPSDPPFASAKKIYFDALLIALARTFLVIRWRGRGDQHVNSQTAGERGS